MPGQCRLGVDVVEVFYEQYPIKLVVKLQLELTILYRKGPTKGSVADGRVRGDFYFFLVCKNLHLEMYF